MIIVTGPGRSGTSMMIKFLKNCDLDIGSDKWFDAMNAGLENKETLHINSRLLSHYVKGQKINPYYIWGDIYGLKYDAVKDPQFVMHPQLIKNWHKVRDDLKVIFMHRKPADIVASAKKNMEWTQPTYRLFEEEIIKKNDTFLKQLDRLKIEYITFKYPHIAGIDVVNKCSEWIDLPDNALEIWKQTYDLPHHTI